MSPRRLLSVLALALTALVAGAPALRAQERPLDDARQRWERLDPEQRARMHERFQRFRELDPGQREALEARARFLREAMRRVEERLSPEQRAQLQGLDPARRREMLRELVVSDVRERGERILGSMPEAWRQRLEQASPEERAHVLLEMQTRMCDRTSRRSLEHLGQHLGLSPQQVEELRALPEEERLRKVLELRKELALRKAATDGLPGFVNAEQWREWSELSPAEFFERMERARRQYEAGPDGWKQGGRWQDARRLFEALKPRPEDMLAVAELPEGERHARIEALVQQRVLGVLRETSLVPAERIAELEALTPEQFHEAVRRVLGWRGGRRGGWGGERGPDGERGAEGERGPGGDARSGGDRWPGRGGDRERRPGGGHGGERPHAPERDAGAPAPDEQRPAPRDASDPPGGRGRRS